MSDWEALAARLDELEQTARGSWWWQQGWRDAQRWFWRRSSDGATLDPPHPLWRVPVGWRLLPPGRSRPRRRSERHERDAGGVRRRSAAGD